MNEHGPLRRRDERRRFGTASDKSGALRSFCCVDLHVGSVRKLNSKLTNGVAKRKSRSLSFDSKSRNDTSKGSFGFLCSDHWLVNNDREIPAALAACRSCPTRAKTTAGTSTSCREGRT